MDCRCKSGYEIHFTLKTSHGPNDFVFGFYQLALDVLLSLLNFYREIQLLSHVGTKAENLRFNFRNLSQRLTLQFKGKYLPELIIDPLHGFFVYFLY